LFIIIKNTKILHFWHSVLIGYNSVIGEKVDFSKHEGQVIIGLASAKINATRA